MTEQAWAHCACDAVRAARLRVDNIPGAFRVKRGVLCSVCTSSHHYLFGVLTLHSIGNLLGEENAKRAAVAAKCSILMSLVISTVWRYVYILSSTRVLLNLCHSTMFMVFRNSWAHLFNDDPGKLLDTQTSH